jgi:hypothetical protein
MKEQVLVLPRKGENGATHTLYPMASIAYAIVGIGRSGGVERID